MWQQWIKQTEIPAIVEWSLAGGFADVFFGSKRFLAVGLGKIEKQRFQAHPPVQQQQMFIYDSLMGMPRR